MLDCMYRQYMFTISLDYSVTVILPDLLSVLLLVYCLEEDCAFCLDYRGRLTLDL